MARLCTQMNCLLQENVLKRLHQRNVFTVVDLLTEDPEKLVHITKLPYKEVLQIRQSIIANYSALPRKGTDAYNELIINSALIPTGIESLDTMLEGGLLTGKIYEICGSSGSGKTQLCLTISSNFAHDFKQQLHYIDAKKDFSGKRIQEILEAKHCSDEVIGAIMEKIQITRIKNVYELFSFLHHLKNNLQHEQDGQHSVRIIIIDSISVLFFPFLGEKHNDGLGLMQLLSNTMKYIVTEHHIIIVIVNLATHWIEDSNTPVDKNLETSIQEENPADAMRPAIGKSWLDVPCTRLMIYKLNSEETRQITVIKSTYLSVGKQCQVLINSKGTASN